LSDGRLRRLAARVAAAPLRTTGFVVALLVAIGLVATGSAVEVSSRPQFCGSCHIMKPYYDSWKESSHQHIACVDCHIPPGVTAEIRKKYEALSMVARYFTGTYGTNPWAEIEDASCLRCHERRLLVGKELVADVLFDHAAHLSEMRRGKTLRCTSCHSQIVQGSHIAVTTSTCILCHFKGQASGHGTARCTLCHHIPGKVVKVGGTTFNHADVGRFGMDCTWCHARPAGSDGEVPRERCATCHNQAARLEEYDNTELLHRKHVTEHKVDCMNCHLLVEHVAPVRPETAEARIATAASSCASCHTRGHSPQLGLYTGTGGRGVEPMPSAMFEAGVRCEGCHFSLPGHAGHVNKATDVSCMACHGPSYRSIYLGWKEGTTRRVAALRSQIDTTTRVLGSNAPAPLADARFNFDLVAEGRGVHNVPYAYALLRRAHDDMNAARRARGLEPLSRPWRESATSSPCLSCHEGIEEQGGGIFGRRFEHGRHLVAARLDCQACHRTHEDRPKGEVVRFAASGCDSCHHGSAKADCLACHARVREGAVKSFRGDFDHAFHIDEAAQACADCHDLSASPPGLKRDTCAACHEG
jgi:nitrate/TMAO reductase-like tetraheme cytochrome c subunit